MFDVNPDQKKKIENREMASLWILRRNRPKKRAFWDERDIRVRILVTSVQLAACSVSISKPRPGLPEKPIWSVDKTFCSFSLELSWF